MFEKKESYNYGTDENGAVGEEKVALEQEKVAFEAKKVAFERSISELKINKPMLFEE